MDSGIAPVMGSRTNDAAYHVLMAREHVIQTASAHNLSRCQRGSSASSVRSLRAGTTSAGRPPSRASSAGSMRSLSSTTIGSANRSRSGSRSGSRPNSAAALLGSYNAGLLKPQTPWPTRDSIDPTVLIHGSSGKVKNAKRGRVVASARLFSSRLEEELKCMGLREPDRVVFFRSMLAEVGLDALLASGEASASGSRPPSAAESTSSSALIIDERPPQHNPLEAYGVQDSETALEKRVAATIAHYSENVSDESPFDVKTVVRGLLVRGQEDAAFRDEFEMTKMRLAMAETEAEEAGDSAEYEALRASEAESAAALTTRREAAAVKDAQASRAMCREAQVALVARGSTDSSLAWARSQREHELKRTAARATSYAQEMERSARRSQRKQGRATELAMEKQDESSDMANFSRYQIIDLQRSLTRSQQQVAEVTAQLEESRSAGGDAGVQLRDAQAWIEGNARMAAESRSIEERLQEQALDIETAMGLQLTTAEARTVAVQKECDGLARSLGELQKRLDVAEYQRSMTDRKIKSVGLTHTKAVKELVEKVEKLEGMLREVLARWEEGQQPADIAAFDNKEDNWQGQGPASDSYYGGKAAVGEDRVRDYVQQQYLVPQILAEVKPEDLTRGQWTFSASSAGTASSMWVENVSPFTIPEGARVKMERGGDGLAGGGRTVGTEWVYHASLEHEGIGKLQACGMAGSDARTHGLGDDECDSEENGLLLLVTPEAKEAAAKKAAPGAPAGNAQVMRVPASPL